MQFALLHLGILSGAALTTLVINRLNADQRGEPILWPFGLMLLVAYGLGMVSGLKVRWRWLLLLTPLVALFAIGEPILWAFGLVLLVVYGLGMVIGLKVRSMWLLLPTTVVALFAIGLSSSRFD